MKKARSTLAIVSVLTIGLASFLAATAGAKTSKKGSKESGTAYVSIVYTKGSTQYAAGYTFDSKFGQTATTYQIALSSGTTGNLNVTAKKVTLYAPQGTLRGTGSGVENLSTGALSNGKLNLTHGTGKLKGHSFKGTFTGTYNSSSRVFTFKYTGTYK